MMANIAMIVSNPCDPDPRVEKEATSLVDAGHEVTIHAFDRNETLEKEFNLGNVKILRHRIGDTPKGAPSLMTGIQVLIGLRKFRREVLKFLLKNTPDIVHCHDADTLEVGLRMKSLRGTKLIFDMHDLAHTWARMERPRSIIRKIVAGLIERRVVKRMKKCDLIVTSSGSVSKTSHPGFREWVKKRVKNKDIIVVENRPISKVENLPLPNRFTVGYAGTIREISMFDNLIKTIEKWPFEPLPKIIIAGHGTADAKVDELIKKSNLEIVRINKFQRNEIPEIISNISVMFAVYPTTRGNILDGALPTKMFDAANLGRPSIVNSGCLMSDIAKAENLGIPIDPRDSGELLNALIELYQEPMAVKLERDWNGEVGRLLSSYSRLENDS